MLLLLGVLKARDTAANHDTRENPTNR
jgi:hypothetical protein